MTNISLSEIKDNPEIVGKIRWEVTPQLFLDPKSAGGDPVDIEYGFMLYIDLVDDKPQLMVMQLKKIVSKTVGIVTDVPEDMLREAMNCTDKECVAGMYPLGEKLESWLKQELAIV